MKIDRLEVRNALDVAFSIPGLYGRDEGAFLYRLARRKGKMVELGCWMGRTTAIMLQAGSVFGAELTTVDAFTPMKSQKIHATPDRWRANLKKAGLKPPKLLAMKTDEAAGQYLHAQDISLLFIDALHTEEQVSRDLAIWTPWIKVGGIVALHDMFFPSIPGVAAAVAEWWKRERDGTRPFWRCLGMRRYTIAFKRMK